MPTQPSVLRAMYRVPGVGSSVDGGGTAVVPGAFSRRRRYDGGVVREGVGVAPRGCNMTLLIAPQCHRRAGTGDTRNRGFPLEPTNCTAVVRGKFH